MIIYKITNTVTNKIYIGQTVNSLDERWWGHTAKYNNKDGRYGANSYLYNSMRKHGIDKFDIEKIDEARTKEELDAKEAYWIKKLDTIERGYNILPGGKFNPMHDESVKRKHLERMSSEDVREIISKTMLKYRAENPISQETSEKLSNKSQKAWEEGRMPEPIMTPEIQAMAVEANKRRTKITVISTGEVMYFDSMKEANTHLVENGYFTTTYKSWKSIAGQAKVSNETGEPFDGILWEY